MSEEGTSLLEFTLVLGFFFLLIFGLIDSARYLLVKTTLEAGAQDGLRLAKTLPGIELDLRKIPSTDPLASNFYNLEMSIASVTTALPQSATISLSSVSSAAMLQKATLTEQWQDKQVSHQADVIFLRPGDSAKIDDQWIDHPTVCAQDSPTCARSIRDSDNYEALMKSEPLVVQVRTQLRLFVLGGNRITVTGTAIGFREDRDAVVPLKEKNAPVILLMANLDIHKKILVRTIMIANSQEMTTSFIIPILTAVKTAL